MKVRRRLLVVVAVVAAALLLAGGLATSALRSGLATHQEPSALEAMAARAVRRWATPAELRAARNPLAPSPAVLADARAHWADHCATCHGNDGKGKTAIGEQLYPRAPDMTLPRTQSLSDGELFAIIENGVRLTGMPGWGDGTAASGYASWSLVHFIRHLPDLDPGELAAMEGLNPRSLAEWEELRAEQEFLAGGAPPAPTHQDHGNAHGH